MRRVCLIVLVMVAAAHAEPALGSEADRLFEEGRALAKAGDYATACERFTHSLEIDHSLGTELNLADCKEKLGHLREAWRLFTAVAQESARSADTKRTQFARERAMAVTAKLTTVVIKVARPMIGMSITVGDHAVEPTTEIIDVVEPGAIQIGASMPRHAPFSTTLEGKPGVTLHVTIPPFEEVDPAPIAKTRYERRRGRVYLAGGLFVGFAAAAVASTVFALEGRSDYNETADGLNCMRVAAGIECDAIGTRDIHSAQRLADIGTFVGIGAGALLAGAIITYVTAPMEAVTITPAVAPDRVGLVLRAQW